MGAKREIGFDEWLSQLEGCVQGGDVDGLSVVEIMKRTGRGRHWVTKQLQVLLKSGAWSVFWVLRPDMTGRPSPVPIYRPTKGKAKC